MRILILIVATAALLLENVTSEEDGIKRGTYPFMAFVYYPDETVGNAAGAKFIRSAVLIRESWLISSSLENENTLIAFPEKTLVARLGAISIDDKLDLNEDEDEQEREIIRISRPFNFNSSEWWNSDISLLKTLLPFNITLVVAPFETRSNKLNFNENCFMLVYAKQNESATETRNLMKISVELISSMQDKCGSNFNNDTMVCAAPSSEKSDIYMDSNYCLSNSGGPLICGNELTGIQTYIDNCNPPYLYQLLNSWDDLISCATQEKCLEEQCAKICYTINKDPITIATPNITITTEAIMKLADGYVNESNFEIFISSTFTTGKRTSEAETEKITLITAKEEASTEMTTFSTVSETQTTETTTMTSSQSTERVTSDIPDERERETNVEAQQHITVRSDASTNIMLYSLKYFMHVFSVIVLLA